MAFLRGLLVIICTVTATVLAAPATRATRPIVKLDKGTFTGTTADGVNEFLGIPFAQPPVGDLRFRLPQALGPYSGTHNVTAFGLSCTQQAITLTIPNGLPQQTLELIVRLFGNGTTTLLDGEDCEEAIQVVGARLRTRRRAILIIVVGLTLNVVAPSQVNHRSKLPVVVWIYGGGFEFGSSAFYDGGVIVRRSIALKEPVIYVSMNYRLSGVSAPQIDIFSRQISPLLAFGFLASQEVKDAKVGNLGLWDQRLALRWVQKYIHAFGGDPSKVTIWGESAGSISVSLQMLANGGKTEGLFRAAFMQSGSPTPIGDITNGQQYYDELVERTNCSGSSDTLACLRAASYEKLKAVIDSSRFRSGQQTTPESLVPAWQPRADGIFLADDPQKLVLQGKVADIPFVTGECDDEGTIFSLSESNITTETELRNYLSEFLPPNATDAEVDSY
ncbi:Alpha/Beta hydrolase protein [Lactarius psammicola]|nr:Alpha/Beta hydrolase protein [Lactarius psammicola]